MPTATFWKYGGIYEKLRTTLTITNRCSGVSSWPGNSGCWWNPYPIRRTPNIARRLACSANPTSTAIPAPARTASFDRNGRFLPVRRPLPRNGTGSEVVPNDLLELRTRSGLLLLAGIDEASHAAAAIVLLPQPAQDRCEHSTIRRNALQHGRPPGFARQTLLHKKPANAIPNLS